VLLALSLLYCVYCCVDVDVAIFVNTPKLVVTGVYPDFFPTRTCFIGTSFRPYLIIAGLKKNEFSRFYLLIRSF